MFVIRQSTEFECPIPNPFRTHVRCPALARAQSCTHRSTAHTTWDTASQPAQSSRTVSITWSTMPNQAHISQSQPSRQETEHTLTSMVAASAQVLVCTWVNHMRCAHSITHTFHPVPKVESSTRTLAQIYHKFISATQHRNSLSQSQSQPNQHILANQP